jgi:hypothetical protein
MQYIVRCHYIYNSLLCLFCLMCVLIYLIISRLPLWSSGQNSCWQTQRSQIFWEAVCLKWSPFRLMSIIEELLEWKVAASVYKTEINGCADPSHWPRDTHLSSKVSTKIRRLVAVAVSIVCLWTKSMELLFVCLYLIISYIISLPGWY